MTYDKRGAGHPDNQGLLPEGRGHEVIQSQADERIPDGWRAILVNSMAKRGLERVIRNGASSLSLSLRNTVGPCRRGGNSSLDGLGVTRILSSRWCLVKLEGKQCETLPPPVQHSTTAFITTFSMTSHHTPGSGLLFHGRECGERPPMWPIIR